jgi:hypothetical protein
MNYKIQKHIKFQLFLNFKGVQTIWKKSHQFTKILPSYDLHEYEFRLTHLYVKFGCSLTSGN